MTTYYIDNCLFLAAAANLLGMPKSSLADLGKLCLANAKLKASAL